MTNERAERPSFDRGVKAKIAANVIITSALAVLLALLVNYGVHRVGKQKTIRYDLTRGGTFTLDETSRRMIEGLDEEVVAYALFAEFDPRITSAARPSLGANTADSGLVNRYYRPSLDAMRGRLSALFDEARRLNPKLRLEAVDARGDGATPRRWLKELELDQAQLVNHLVFYNPRTGKKRSFDLFRVFDFKLGGPTAAGFVPPRLQGDYIDAYLVAGLKAVTRGATLRAGVALGHGEEGRPAIVRVLQAEGFEVKPLDLGTESSIPGDLDLLVVVSPSRAWRPEAREAILSYAETGGTVLLTQGRLCQEPFEDLLGAFGVELRSVQVSHPTAHDVQRGPFELRGASLLRPAAQQAPHPATELLVADLLPVHVGFSRAYRVLEDARDGQRDVDSLLRTGEEGQAVAWIFGRGGWRQAPERETVRGEDMPLALALRRPLDGGAADEESRETRIACFGSDEWLEARRFSEGFNLANRDLFTSTVYWLVGREKLVTRAPRVYTRHLARLEEDDMKTFSALTLWILPALALLAGLLVFLVRRRS